MTLNMEYYDNNNMGQWHYAKIKENKLLVKPSIPTPNLEANTLIHITILKNSVTFSYIYIYIQGVPGGKDLTSGECSLGQTIPI